MFVRRGSRRRKLATAVAPSFFDKEHSVSSFEFTKVVIVESLESSEFKSGSELYKFICDLKAAHPDVPEAELIEVAGRDEFIATITTLTNRVKTSGESPILQIEMHGWDDKTGLAFPDHTSLSWDDLAAALGNLNRATRFNLVVCVAACFGGHFIGALLPHSPSPCFAMIGPTHSMTAGELLGGFSTFYGELLTMREAGAALTALHSHRFNEGGFVTATAEDWFFRIAEGYLLTHCTPDRLKARGENILASLRKEGRELNPEQCERIARIGDELASAFLDRRFSSFFMTDSIPENQLRFAGSLSRAKLRVKSLLAESDRGFSAGT